MSRCSTMIAAAALPIVALLGMTSAAPAQMESREAIGLQNQILELRHEVQQLEAQGGGAQPGYGQPAPAPSIGAASETASDLLTRVTSLEEQVRQLRGRVDELENTLQRTTADLGKQMDDMKFQLQNPQGGPPSAGPRPAALAAPSAAAASPAAAAVLPEPGGPRTPEVALQEGYAAMGRRDYTAAEHDAQEVLSKRTSPRAYDAQYLLAQSLAGQHQWSRAAVAYDDAYVRSPKGGHAQESLLGLAISLTAINEKRAACDTLTKLRNEFPHPRPELHDQIAEIGQRAGCRS